MATRKWPSISLLVVALTLGACSTSVPGQATRGSGQPTSSSSAKAKPAPVPISARDLLLQDATATPLGDAIAIPVGDSYFTSVRPPECAAALLFKSSPLLPPAASDHAESAYQVNGPALYAESANVYSNPVDDHDVVWKGFSAVSDCRGEAIGVAPLGAFKPMKLSFFATSSDGVLVWTMTRADWTCDFGLAAIPRVVLLMAACDTKPGFPMADWAAKRRAQISGGTA
jgi:hypothetical protein